MENSARLFHCARCHCQVVICTDCDRGNIYCVLCSKSARAKSLKMANKRYRNTKKGKRKNAERQARYRQRQKKVTHQGSFNLSLNDVLPLVPDEQKIAEKVLVQIGIHCHFCGRVCSEFMRSGFLRHDKNDESKILSFFAGAP